VDHATIHSRVENNMLSSSVHSLSGMRGRCKCGFLDQLRLCFLTKDIPDFSVHRLSSFKVIGGVFVTVFRIGYFIGADLRIVV